MPLRDYIDAESPVPEVNPRLGMMPTRGEGPRPREKSLVELKDLPLEDKGLGGAEFLIGGVPAARLGMAAEKAALPYLDRLIGGRLGHAAARWSVGGGVGGGAYVPYDRIMADQPEQRMSIPEGMLWGAVTSALVGPLAVMARDAAGPVLRAAAHPARQFVVELLERLESMPGLAGNEAGRVSIGPEAERKIRELFTDPLATKAKFEAFREAKGWPSLPKKKQPSMGDQLGDYLDEVFESLGIQRLGLTADQARNRADRLADFLSISMDQLRKNRASYGLPTDDAFMERAGGWYRRMAGGRLEKEKVLNEVLADPDVLRAFMVMESAMSPMSSPTNEMQYAHQALRGALQSPSGRTVPKYQLGSENPALPGGMGAGFGPSSSGNVDTFQKFISLAHHYGKGDVVKGMQEMGKFFAEPYRPVAEVLDFYAPLAAYGHKPVTIQPGSSIARTLFRRADGSRPTLEEAVSTRGAKLNKELLAGEVMSTTGLLSQKTAPYAGAKIGHGAGNVPDTWMLRLDNMAQGLPRGDLRTSGYRLESMQDAMERVARNFDLPDASSAQAESWVGTAKAFQEALTGEIPESTIRAGRTLDMQPTHVELIELLSDTGSDLYGGHLGRKGGMYWPTVETLEQQAAKGKFRFTKKDAAKYEEARAAEMARQRIAEKERSAIELLGEAAPPRPAGRMVLVGKFGTAAEAERAAGLARVDGFHVEVRAEKSGSKQARYSLYRSVEAR